MDTPLNDTSGDSYDLWLSRFVRTSAALLGASVFVYEVVEGNNIEFALLGIGMMGLPFGRAIDNILAWIQTFHPDPPSKEKS